MSPEDIGKAYDSITHLWQSKDFNLENGIAQHKRALAFLKNKGEALDIGCGCTGRFIDLLQKAGLKVEGVDVSKKMLELAKEKHPEVTFHHQDICQWGIPKQYDFITAWDSLWHIPLSKQKIVVAKMVKALKPEGIIIFSFGGIDEENEHTDDYMGPKVYYSSLGTNGFLQAFVDNGCIIKHMEFDQKEGDHAYLIAQKV